MVTFVQQYLSCYWPDFETLNVGPWEHLQQIPIVTVTIVQATFVHISNISSITDPNLFGLKIFDLQSLLDLKVFWTQKSFDQNILLTTISLPTFYNSVNVLKNYQKCSQSRVILFLVLFHTLYYGLTERWLGRCYSQENPTWCYFCDKGPFIYNVSFFYAILDIKYDCSEDYTTPQFQP